MSPRSSNIGYSILFYKPSGRGVCVDAAATYILSVTTGNSFEREESMCNSMKEEARAKKKKKKMLLLGNKETEAVGPPP